MSHSSPISHFERAINERATKPPHSSHDEHEPIRCVLEPEDLELILFGRVVPTKPCPLWFDFSGDVGLRNNGDYQFDRRWNTEEHLFLRWVASTIDLFLSSQHSPFHLSIIGNFPILVALLDESSLHPPSKFLYRCLATADLIFLLFKTRSREST